MNQAVKLDSLQPINLDVQNRVTIEKMVDAFSHQNIDAIMDLFSDDAIYHDVQGSKEKGNTYIGKASIRTYYKRIFNIMPTHHYEDATILVNGNQAHANWTLVITPKNNTGSVFRMSGGDYFELEGGKVKFKNAWLKNIMAVRLAVLRMKLREIF